MTLKHLLLDTLDQTQRAIWKPFSDDRFECPECKILSYSRAPIAHETNCPYFIGSLRRLSEKELLKYLLAG